MHARPRCSETSANPKRLGPRYRYHRAGYNRSAVSYCKKAFGSVTPMAWAEAWGAALLMAQLWVLASVAALLSAMLLQ